MKASAGDRSVRAVRRAGLAVWFLALAGCGGGGAQTASLASIDVTPLNPQMVRGYTRQMTATGRYSDGSSRDLTAEAAWSSSAPGVASVSAGGLAAAKAAGTAQIRAVLGNVVGETTATVVSQNVAFVTSILGSGDLASWTDSGGAAGLAGADAVCQARAAAAGLTGSFRAWLSDANDDAYCRVHGLSGKRSANCGQPTLPADAGPWVRTDGFPFGGAIAELLDGVVYAPVRFDEFGAALPSPTSYITATTVDGSLHPGSTTCTGWTSAAGSGAGGGNTDMTSGTWTNEFYYSCSGPFALICLQVGAGPVLPPFAVTGKRAFLTSAMGTGDLSSWPQAGGQTGIAAGDAICQGLAASAGLSGATAFKAWLSDAGTDAVSRLAGDGPWVRLDGVLVAESKADLTDGSLFTSVNLTEAGSYMGNYGVWSGTSDAGLKTGYDCAGWSDGTASAQGSYGVAANAGAYWSAWPGQGLDCSIGAFLLRCVED